MSLTLKEVINLPILKDFRLLAGREGLSRRIVEVNILDYEYIDNPPDNIEPDGKFHRGALVLASMVFAKDRPELILPVFRQLLIDGCCGVAVKDIYYETFSQQVLDFSDAEKFPIFVFSGTDMENIIYDIYAAINQQNVQAADEQKLTELIEGNPSADRTKELILSLMGHFSSRYYCRYYRPITVIDTFSYERMIAFLRRKPEADYRYFPYKGGILAVGTAGKEITMPNDIILPDNFTVGTSHVCYRLQEFAFAAVESISATDYAIQKGIKSADFDQIGLYQLLLPNRNNYWALRFCNDIANKIHVHDPDAKLWETVKAYVNNEMDYQATGIELSLHKNSVRYRLEKVSNLLGYEFENSEVRCILSFVVKHFQIRSL